MEFGIAALTGVVVWATLVIKDKLDKIIVLLKPPPQIVMEQLQKGPTYLCPGCFAKTGLTEALTMGQLSERHCDECGVMVPPNTGSFIWKHKQ